MATDAAYRLPPAAYVLQRRKLDPDKVSPAQREEALNYLLSYFAERVYQKIKEETVVKAGNLQELDRLLWTLENSVMEIIDELDYDSRHSLHVILADLFYSRKLNGRINLRFTPLYVYDEGSVQSLDHIISCNLYSFLLNATYTGTRPIFHRLAEKIGMRAKTY